MKTTCHAEKAKCHASKDSVCHDERNQVNDRQGKKRKYSQLYPSYAISHIDLTLSLVSLVISIQFPDNICTPEPNPTVQKRSVCKSLISCRSSLNRGASLLFVRSERKSQHAQCK